MFITVYDHVILLAFKQIKKERKKEKKRKNTVRLKIRLSVHQSVCHTSALCRNG